MAPPPMPMLNASPVGTVSFLSTTYPTTISPAGVDHILELIPCCSVTLELHPMILQPFLLVQARATQMVLLSLEVASSKLA